MPDETTPEAEEPTSAEVKEDASDEDGPETATVRYEKTPSYNVIDVDGMHGGWTQREKLRVDLYSEKGTPPKRQKFEVRDGYRFGEKLEEDQPGAEFTREIEASLSMDVPTAIQVVSWLRRQLKDGLDVESLPSSVAEQLGFQQEVKNNE